MTQSTRLSDFIPTALMWTAVISRSRNASLNPANSVNESYPGHMLVVSMQCRQAGLCRRDIRIDLTTWFAARRSRTRRRT